MSTISINLHGVPQVRNAMRVLKRAGLVAAGRGLYHEGEFIMGESKMPHNVPVKDAVLQSSGHVNPPVVGGAAGGVVVTLGYGGAAKAYAAVQHENLTFIHPSGGRAKYLEIPAMQRASEIGISVAKELAAELAKKAAQTRTKKAGKGR